MTTVEFEVSLEKLNSLLHEYPNLGKNSHIGNLAVKIVGFYFLSIDSNTSFLIGENGADLVVQSKGKTVPYEIKGTAANTISRSKLKVSSQHSFNALINGMTLIRVTNIGDTKMRLHFLKHGIDYKLTPEPRWSVKPM